MSKPVFAAYIGVIVLANWAIEAFGMVPVGFGLLAPAGVYFAGLSLSLRDMLHETAQRRVVVLAILIGAGVSAFVSPQFALASGIAFLISELADFAVYGPIRERSKSLALALSNTVGLVIDSALFLWLAFGSFDYIAGQIVGKAWITGASVALLLAYQQREMIRRRT